MFHNYPYTDFHELNLDALLNKIKDIEDIINRQTIPIEGRLGNNDIENMSFWQQIYDQHGELISDRFKYTSNDYRDFNPHLFLQDEIEYNDETGSGGTAFTRVKGGVFDLKGTGKGLNINESTSPNFTALAGVATNAFAGNIGMTGVTGRVSDIYSTDVDEYGAPKIAGGFFQTIRKSPYNAGNYMISLETYSQFNSTGEEDIPYHNNDSFVFDNGTWSCGYHCRAASSGAPISAGILIDASSTAKHGFYNGIVIGSSAFRINNEYTNNETVGINMASWTVTRHGDTGIRFGYARRQIAAKYGLHIESNGGIVMSNSQSGALYTNASADGYNSVIKLSTGATDDKISDNELTEKARFIYQANQEIVGLISYTSTLRLANYNGGTEHAIDYVGDTVSPQQSVTLGSDSKPFLHLILSGRLKLGSTTLSEDELIALKALIA